MAQVTAETARLMREGFVALLSRLLDRGSAPQGGVSWLMQLGSAASARAGLNASFHANTAGGSLSTFSVPGVPGARA